MQAERVPDVLPIAVGVAPPRPRVLCCMPQHGETVYRGSARAVDRFAVGEQDLVEVIGESQSNSSLLAHGFNIQFAKALDSFDAGAITHMAMLHSDVEPVPIVSDDKTRLLYGWVDILWLAMQHTGAVAVSAIVPIKDHNANPRTSTAIFDDENPWAPKRYVRMEDRERLPETFTAADVCGPGEHLGINTGCMLLDLSWPHWDGFAFEIRDRIVKGSDGKRVAQVRPEDWELSRYVHAHGGTVAATWAVRLFHHGHARWANF